MIIVLSNDNFQFFEIGERLGDKIAEPDKVIIGNKSPIFICCNSKDSLIRM